MKKNKNIARLIYEMEYIIGDCCYNPKSYNGYTGEEGANFRYPVYIFNPEYDDLVKRWSCIENIPFKYIETMKYVFGSNHLFIGTGLTKVIEMLEARYNLDFDVLEVEYQKSLKKK